MALQPIAIPTNPDVPAAPGVPPLLRNITTVADKVIILGADAAQLAGLFGPPQWGIFTSGYQPVILGDSVISVDLRKEYRISDYPIEGGAFATYNKVETPGDIRISFATSGTGDLVSVFDAGGAVGSVLSGNNPSAASRSAFLASLAVAASRLDLFTVITPEATYLGYNIIHYDYRRQAREGASMIVVDVWCQEVRLPPAAQSVKVNGQTQPASQAQIASQPPAPGTNSSSGTTIGKTQAPGGSDPLNSGTIQPQRLTPGQDSSLGLSSPTTSPNTGGVGANNGLLGSGGADDGIIDVGGARVVPAGTQAGPIYDKAGNFLGTGYK